MPFAASSYPSSFAFNPRLGRCSLFSHLVFALLHSFYFGLRAHFVPGTHLSRSTFASSLPSTVPLLILYLFPSSTSLTERITYSLSRLFTVFRIFICPISNIGSLRFFNRPNCIDHRSFLFLGVLFLG